MVEDKQKATPEAPPAEHGRLVMWLVVLGIALLFLPLGLLTMQLRMERLALEEEVSALTDSASVTPTPDPDSEDLRSRLLILREVETTLHSLQTTLQDQRQEWPPVMAALLGYDFRQIELTRIAQTDGLLLVEGRAADEDAVLAYVNSLREEGLFRRVQVQSIVRNEERETDRGFDFQLSLEWLEGASDG